MLEKMTVENGVQAKEKIEGLLTQGFTHDDIYIFAHGKEREEDMNDFFDTEEVGMGEAGFFDSIKNKFSKRGDELRSEMRSLGLSEQEADDYEKELDKGKLVLIATKNA